MTAAMPHSATDPVAALRAAIVADRSGEHERAQEAMRQLEQAWPAWDEPSLRLADSLRRTGLMPPAEQAYRRTLARNPGRIEALVALGAALVIRGAGAEAQTLLIQACGQAPGNAEAWDALGHALHQTDEHGTAETAFAEAQRLAPDNFNFALHRAQAARRAGTVPAELARLEAASAADPLNSSLLAIRGVMLDQDGQREAAIEMLEAATALDPDKAAFWALLGAALGGAMRTAEAAIALRRAHALDPADARARFDLAATLARLHRHAEARALLDALIAERGENVILLCNQACNLVSLGLQEPAERMIRQALAMAPGSAAAHRALVNTLPYCADASGAGLFEALRNCSDALPRTASIHMPALGPERRLRLGLLSGILRTHPVGWLTVAGLEALDPAAFEIVCLGPQTFDPMARRFAAIASAWHDTAGLSDTALAAFTRELGIDVLIDLGGYGDAGRMTACAQRLAPMQVKWVGMQNHSSGLAEMDWFITDRWETPDDAGHLYSERLLRLRDGYVCYSPPPHAPDIGPLPALTNEFVTFGCFNNIAKITPVVIAAWCRLLTRMPDARLVLKTHQFSEAETCARVRADFAANGIDPDRIQLRGASPHRAFMAEYNDIDIVLDPFPYSGGLTTCEALWMGVPTVTLPGSTFASRHTLIHMSNAGLHGWDAASVDDYVDLAVARASDIPALAALRGSLRAQVKASPLVDARRFGQSLGDALRHAWRVMCEAG